MLTKFQIAMPAPVTIPVIPDKEAIIGFTVVSIPDAAAATGFEKTSCASLFPKTAFAPRSNVLPIFPPASVKAFPIPPPAAISMPRLEAIADPIF